MFEINDQTKKIIFIGITILLFILFIASNNNNNSKNMKESVSKHLQEKKVKSSSSCCGNSNNIHKIRDTYQEEEEEEISLDGDKPMIMNFNTDWCYYSKKFQPIWDDFSKKMKAKNITIKDIKCDKSDNESLCAKYDVEGFPTVKLVKNNKVYEYTGKRTVDDLSNYANQYIN